MLSGYSVHWLNSGTFVKGQLDLTNGAYGPNYAIGQTAPPGHPGAPLYLNPIEQARENTPHDYFIFGSRHQSNFDNNNSLSTRPGYDGTVLHIYQIDRNNTTIDWYGNNTGTNPDGKWNGWVTDIPMMGFLQSTGGLEQEQGIHVTNGTDKFLPVFYQANGGIRVCDGGFLSHIWSKLWLGYIRDDKLFNGNELGLNIENFKVDNWVIDYGAAPRQHVDADETINPIQIDPTELGILQPPQTVTLATEGENTGNTFNGWFNNGFASPNTGKVWGPDHIGSVALLYCRKAGGYVAPSNLVSGTEGYKLSLRPSVYEMPTEEGIIGVSLFAKNADGWTSNSYTADENQNESLVDGADANSAYSDGDVVGNINLPWRRGTSSYLDNTEQSVDANRSAGYSVFCSYVYENGEESTLSRFPRFNESSPDFGVGSDHISNHLYGKDLYIDVSFFVNPTVKRIHPRVKGLRLYITTPPDGQMSAGEVAFSYNLVAEMDFSKGSRAAGSVGWKPWVAEADGFRQVPQQDNADKTKYITTCRVTDLGMESFETIHGYSPEEIGTCFYKTALTVNNRVYVGNVKFNDVLYPDRMMKTQIGEYDTFTKSGFIDVQVDDGDSIVHLESFADRILQFKENVVHIINISKEFEFLETSMKHAGVKSSSQVVNTDKGIYWANRSGLYWYNGERIVNLIELLGENVADQADGSEPIGIDTSNNEPAYDVTRWGDLISEKPGLEPVLGYDPINKDVLIIRNKLGEKDVSFIYNTTYNNFTQLFSRTSGYQKSNIVTTTDGDVLYAQNPILDADGDEATAQYLSVWNRDPQSSNVVNNLLLETKPLDFGNHSQRKVIQSVHFTYKSTGESYLIPFIKAFFLDGASPDHYYMAIGTESSLNNSTFTGASAPMRLPDTSGKFETFKYKHVLDNTPHSSTTGSAVTMRSKAKNVGAIQIGLIKLASNSYSTAADFELEEISITYRDKQFK